MRGEAAGRSRRAGLSGGAAGGARHGPRAELLAERSGAERAIGLRVFRGMHVAIDYKLSVSSGSARATPNLRSRNAGRDGNTHGSKLTLSKGCTVGCTELPPQACCTRAWHGDAPQPFKSRLARGARLMRGASGAPNILHFQVGAPSFGRVPKQPAAANLQGAPGAERSPARGFKNALD